MNKLTIPFILLSITGCSGITSDSATELLKECEDPIKLKITYSILANSVELSCNIRGKK